MVEEKSVKNLERKKKKRKKKGKLRKKLIATKSGLVGIKGYPKTYNDVKYFPFLNEIDFYAKLSRWFLGL